MFQAEVQIRVRYSETDRMGYVYYGNYAQYFEVARVEALRELGMNYKEMEDKGIWLPVYTYSVKFIKPAHYDDLLLIRTTLREVSGARVYFNFETFNAEKQLINTAEVVLVFFDSRTNKPCQPPEEFSSLVRSRLG